MNLSVPEHVRTLIPYPPGKPIEELEREYGITGSIKMASNENALGPSPLAVTAICKALASLHRYPDGSCHALARTLAARLGLTPANLVFGNGSDEIIVLLVEAFLQPGEEAISSRPSFLVYPKAVQAQAGVNRIIPLINMRHDLPAIAAAITEKTRLIFLDNPNNPTGTLFGRVEFEAFLSDVPDRVIVVLDEAYIDFADPATRLNLLDYLAGPKPVVGLRTFSKAYGLAGLRVGYGLMSEEIAACVQKVRAPFNVNNLAQVGALAALGDEEHYQKTLRMTREGIAWLTERLRALGLTVYPTQTNFFLVDLGRPCRPVYEAMLRQGVIIRPMNAYDFPNFIRITPGIAAENERLVGALEKSMNELNHAAT